MNAAQSRLYFREWGVVRRKLRAEGVPPAECDARRHRVHLEKIGTDKSHLEFTEDDFDAVLAGFWKISFPGDLARQLRQINMRRTRLLYKIDELLRAQGKDRRFAEGVAEQIADGIDPNSNDAFWQRERQRDVASSYHRSLDQLDPNELKKVIGGLRAVAKRRSNCKSEERAEALPF